MAKLDKLYYGEEDIMGGHEFLNVTASVGRSGVNLPSDVMLVQALLAYLPDDWRGFPARKCPAVTGSFDSVTGAAIQQYQKYHTPPPGVTFFVPCPTFGPMDTDGHVIPAKDRKFRYGSSFQIWTITSLNLHARLIGDIRGLDPNLGYIQEIIDKSSLVKQDLMTPDI